MEVSIWPSVIMGLFFGTLSLSILRSRGLISRDDFSAQPPRRGSLGLGDIFIAAFMFLIVPSFAVEAMRALNLMPDKDASNINMAIANVIVGQSGIFAAAIYVLARVPQALQGGYSGFGLSLAKIPQAMFAGPLALLALFPIVMMISAGVVAILTVMDLRPDMIAHQTLEVLVEDPGGTGWWILVVSAVLVAPVLEELLFRGLLQTGLQQSGIVPSRWTAIAITSFIFAGIHASIASPHALPMLYVLSVGLGWAYERRNNLWTPIAIHALFNGGQIALAVAAQKAMNALENLNV